MGIKDDKRFRRRALSGHPHNHPLLGRGAEAFRQYGSVQCWSLTYTHHVKAMPTGALLQRAANKLHDSVESHSVDSASCPENSSGSATLQSQSHYLSQSPLSCYIHVFGNKTSQRALGVVFLEPCCGCRYARRRHSLCPWRDGFRLV